MLSRVLTYLGRAYPLPSSFELPDLAARIIVDTLVPGTLDPLLQLDDCGYPIWQNLVAGSFGTLKVRNGHLYVAVPAKATFMVIFGNVEDAWVAEPSFLNGGIKFREACEHRDNACCLILASLDCDNPSIATDDVPPEDPGLLLHLGV